MAQAFSPRVGATKSIAVTASSGSVAIPDSDSGVDIRIYNADTQVVFISTGGGSATATTSDLPIAPGAIEVLHFERVAGPRYMAAIGTADNSASIYFTAGAGI